MTPEQLDIALARLFPDKSVTGRRESAAALLRVNRGTVFRWAAGETMPFAVGALLRLMIRYKIKPVEITELMDRRLPPLR